MPNMLEFFHKLDEHERILIDSWSINVHGEHIEFNQFHDREKLKQILDYIIRPEKSEFIASVKIAIKLRKKLKDFL